MQQDLKVSIFVMESWVCLVAQQVQLLAQLVRQMRLRLQFLVQQVVAVLWLH